MAQGRKYGAASKDRTHHSDQARQALHPLHHVEVTMTSEMSSEMLWKKNLNMTRAL